MWLTTSCALQSVTEPRRIDPANEPTPVPTEVDVPETIYTVEQGDLIREIRLSGQIVPLSEIAHAFVQAGTVEEILVEIGDSVDSGDVIAQLSSQSLENELVLAEKGLEVAQSRLAEAEAGIANDRRRAEIAVEQAQLQLDLAIAEASDPPTEQEGIRIDLQALDVELAEITLNELNASIDPQLEAEITRFELQVEEIEGMIARTQIIASAPGTVTRINIREGRDTTPEQTAVVTADLSGLEIRALVNDEDLPLVALDMIGQVNQASRPGESFDAQLVLLPFNAGGIGDEESIVRFQLIDSDHTFAFNDRVTINLVTAAQENVLWLPPQGIREFSGRQFVVVQEGSSRRRVDIRTGLQNGDQVEIISGLELGTVVVGP
ncbi:MAG: efflux RND transporter periplasmic adaptor subunit [Chloroflexota bacterium]